MQFSLLFPLSSLQFCKPSAQKMDLFGYLTSFPDVCTVVIVPLSDTRGLPMFLDCLE